MFSGISRGLLMSAEVLVAPLWNSWGLLLSPAVPLSLACFSVPRLPQVSLGISVGLFSVHTCILSWSYLPQLHYCFATSSPKANPLQLVVISGVFPPDAISSVMSSQAETRLWHSTGAALHHTQGMSPQCSCCSSSLDKVLLSQWASQATKSPWSASKTPSRQRCLLNSWYLSSMAAPHTEVERIESIQRSFDFQAHAVSHIYTYAYSSNKKLKKNIYREGPRKS